jgi:tetratricopeptide (TPR) repeat protein
MHSETPYWSFISYRHADNKSQDRDWASWLHQEIERYEVPAELIGTKNARGDTLPDRIYPVFRDEESLPADADLGNSVESALDRSRFLTVLCSPRAVQSQYVAQEIEHFIESGKGDRIIAAILAGEPGDPEQECFPVPLREVVTEKGTLKEPIAADFRLPDGSEGFTSAEAYRLQLTDHPKGEARKLADAYESQLQLMKLKIIAGILGVPLETLRDRDKAYQLVLAQKRARTLRLWLTAVGVFAIAAVVGGWVALQQRDRAREAREAADKVINTMIYDMRDELYDAGLLKLHEKINSVARDYFRSFPPEGVDDHVIRERAVALDNSVDNFLRLGKTEEAIPLIEQSVHSKEDLYLGNPENPGYQRDLFVGHEKLAKVKWALEGPGAALVHFERRQELCLDLHQRHPDNLTLNDTALGYSFLGDVKLELKGASAALPDYRKSFELSRELHRTAPSNQSTLLLIASHLSLGDALHPIEGPGRALEHYETMTELAGALVDEDPEHALYLGWFRLGNERLGTVKMKLEGPEAALPYFQKRLEITRLRHEVEASSSNIREMAISHFKLGDVRVAMEETDAALSHFETMRELIEGLVEIDATRSNRRWLMLAHARLGGIRMKLADHNAALVHHQKSFEICREIHEEAPSAENTRSLAISHEKLGDLQLESGKAEEALLHYRQRLALMTELHQSDPNLRNTRSLAISHYKMGTAMAERAKAGNEQDRITAREHFESGRDLLQGLADAGKLSSEEMEWIADYDDEAKKLE